MTIYGLSQSSGVERRLKVERGGEGIVLTITDHAGDAIYFSRCPIPFDRDRAADAPYFKHIGLYVYQREFLLEYSALRVGPLEQTERLEQLRFLDNGIDIYVAETPHNTVGVDTEDDLQKVEAILKAGR